MDKHLHIVCFDVPYPPDYGGVIDIFYRLRSLSELGVKIHLHCFEYGRNRQKALEEICTEVKYYNRDTGLKGFSLRHPYIVYSRRNKLLLQNLLKDDHPVLLEGVHCTWLLQGDQLKDRKIFVRLHNVEYEYYKQLATHEVSVLKKLYYNIESRLLKQYERTITHKATFLSITEKDLEVLKLNGTNNIHYLPAFLPYQQVESQTGTGDYCLYHGNLSINENEKAAIMLCDILGGSNMPLVIAGKNPGKKLKRIVQQKKNISLISDPSIEEMNELIMNAQIHLLPSFNPSGIKIKLLSALFHGRHCIVGSETVTGTSVETLTHIADTAEEWKKAIEKLINLPFTIENIETRRSVLEEFNNKRNAEMLMKWIW